MMARQVVSLGPTRPIASGYASPSHYYNWIMSTRPSILACQATGLGCPAHWTPLHTRMTTWWVEE